MDKILTLYTGPHCHLCDEAKALLYPLLHGAGWQLREVDISTDEQLQARYGTRIPVIVSPNGREKGWPFSPGQVRRLIGLS